MKKIYVILLLLFIAPVSADSISIELPVVNSALKYSFVPHSTFYGMHSDFQIDANESAIAMLFYGETAYTHEPFSDFRVFDTKTGFAIAGRDNTSSSKHWGELISAYAWDSDVPRQLLTSQFDGLLRKLAFPIKNQIATVTEGSPFPQLDPMNFLAEVNISIVFQYIFSLSEGSFVGIVNDNVYHIFSNLTVVEIGHITNNYSQIYADDVAVYASVDNMLQIYPFTNFTAVEVYEFANRINYFSVSPMCDVIVQIGDDIYQIINNHSQFIATVSQLSQPRFSIDGQFITLISNNTTIQIRYANDFSLVHAYNFSFPSEYQFFSIINQVLLGGDQQIYFIDWHMYGMNVETSAITVFGTMLSFAGYETSSNKLNAYMMALPLLFFSWLKRKHQHRLIFL